MCILTMFLANVLGCVIVPGTRHAEGGKFSEYTVWPQHTQIYSDIRCIQRTFIPLRAAFREQLRI